jgi:hypothetical protein
MASEPRQLATRPAPAGGRARVGRGPTERPRTPAELLARRTTRADRAVAPGGTQRAQIATFDRLGLVVSSRDSVQDAARAIDPARGKAARFAAPHVRELLAGSRARTDSLAMMLDLSAVVSSVRGAAPAAMPLLVSFGFADRNAHIRVALPAATLHAAVNAANP